MLHFIAPVKELSHVPADTVLDQESASRVSAHIVANIKHQVIQSAKLPALPQSSIISC